VFDPHAKAGAEGVHQLSVSLTSLQWVIGHVKSMVRGTVGKMEQNILRECAVCQILKPINQTCKKITL
jgi:hypothetical protein